MPTRPLGNSTVVVVRAPLVTDPRDNTQYRDWANATRTTVKNCLIEPFPLAEKLNKEDSRNREYSQSAVRVYMPAKTDIVYSDRMEFSNHEWQVLGHPEAWEAFSAIKDHKAVIAKIRQG